MRLIRLGQHPRVATPPIDSPPQILRTDTASLESTPKTLKRKIAFAEVNVDDVDITSKADDTEREKKPAKSIRFAV